MKTYSLFGQHVRSEIPLHAQVVDERPDIEVVRSSDAHQQPIKGRVLADTDAPGEGYVVIDRGDRTVVRFRTLVDFEIEKARITATLAPGCDPELAGILVTGNVMATRMTLEGRCVLHASAVAVHDDAIAFVGPPGMGKSTLAALLVGRGAAFVTDDVLVLEVVQGEMVCVPSGTSLRLRPGAAWLRDALGDRGVTSTDGRTMIALSTPPAPTLKTIVFPAPTRSLSNPEVHRLTPQEALMKLASYPRLLGWRDPNILRSSFRHNSVIARRIPCFAARLPWGPPFDEETLAHLVALAR